MEWMLLPFRRYAQFSGRSRRKEYWMFTLLNVIVIAVLYALMLAGGGADLLANTMAAQGDPQSLDMVGSSVGPLFWIGFALLCLYGLAIIIPSIALTVRRLHDRNLTGWIYLGVIIVSLIPIPLLSLIAGIGMFVLMLLPGTPGPNKYGPDPKDPAQAEVFA